MHDRPPVTDPAAPVTHTPARATAAGSARYAARHGGSANAASFGAAAGGLTLSALGAGTYLGDCTDAEDLRYVAALREALRDGVNVLDTAINYRCQRSERAIGVALQEAFAADEVRRDEVVVCTKGGYLPLEGAPPVKRSEYESYLDREFFAPGVLHRDDVVGGGHSLAPSFLRYAIARSLQNLGVGTIDVYYLHNPEQQLASAPPAVLRERLRAAFTLLEEAVASGEIGAYGVATWAGLRVPANARGHLSLAELVAGARQVAGDAHHLRFVQLPLSLAMPEAIRLPTQRVGDRMLPASEAAVELGLTVIASATLMQGQLTHGLPDAARELFPHARTDAQRALAFACSAPGVTTALAGMRRPEHVRENLVGAKHVPTA